MLRRIKVFLALVAVMVPMLAAFAGPAMAIQCDREGRNFVECGRHDTLFERADRGDNFFGNDFLFPSLFDFDLLDNEFGDENEADVDTFDVGGTDCFTVDEDVFCNIGGRIVEIT